MSILPADAGDDAWADAGDDASVGFLAGVVALCAGCCRAEGELGCEGCGDRLCPDCWGAGEEMFCEACLGEEPEPRPVEDVSMREGYL